MTPSEIVNRLKELHDLRVKTREIARTKLQPGEVRSFIDHFTFIEMVVLLEIEKDILNWSEEVNFEISKLKKHIEKLESQNLHTSPLEANQSAPEKVQ